MHDREIEHPDRADCRTCDGVGSYAYGPTDRPTRQQCEDCLGTGKEQTRRDFEQADGSSDLRLVPLDEVVE